MSSIFCSNGFPSELNKVEKDFNADEINHFESDYNIDNEIGRGRFAKVCLVKHKITGEPRAAKIIRRWRNGKDTIENIRREIEIIERGQHNMHIIGMKQYYIGQKEVVLLLEHCSHGDLYHYVNYSEETLSEDYVREAIKQLLRAVSFLHSLSIVHLDIKPENILIRRPIPECDIALCDFGLAKYLDKQKIIRDLVGTPDYAAPEILDYNPIHLSTDMWSVGVVTYYLLTSESPFWDSTKEKTFENVCQLKITYPQQLFQDISNEAVNLIQSLVRKDPRERLSAEECFKHPWLIESKIVNSDSAETQLDFQMVGSSTSDFGRPDVDRSFGEF